MKKFFTLLLLTCIASAMQAQLLESEMTFKKKLHDYGIVAQDTCVVTCSFTFTNTGNGPLVIHQAATSCGCTVPEYTQEPIAPGKSGVINVTYNGKTKRPGVFKKSITIHSNAKNTPVRIYIQGEMIPSENFEDIVNGATTDSPVIQQDLEPEEKQPVQEVKPAAQEKKPATQVKKPATTSKTGKSGKTGTSGKSGKSGKTGTSGKSGK